MPKMDTDTSEKKTMKILEKIFHIAVYTALICICLAVILPVFVCDQFRIGGESMYPTLESGDHILVNKLAMGARIYRKYDFSDPDMECFRMPGLRKIRPGDVAVFNFPRGRDREKIEFRINYVYAKRCIGCPGDTVGIDAGFYYNTRFPGRIFGSVSMQDALRGMSDDVLKDMVEYVAAIPYSPEFGWTVRDFGPMYIPGKGGRIAVDTSSVRLYSRMMEYETGVLPEICGDKVYLGGRHITEYEFSSDWYFFGGDNVLNSKDSRYVGLVPEDYIVGIAARILFSRDPYTGIFDWQRFMKRIDSNAGKGK